MMVKIFPPFWLIAFIIFTINQIVEYFGIYIPYIHSYLDDVLAVPIVLGFTLSIQQQFTYRNLDYTFSVFHVIFFTLGLSWYFEWYLPQVYTYHYQDILDVVAYALGAWFFWQKMNVPSKYFVYKTKKAPYLDVGRMKSSE